MPPVPAATPAPALLSNVKIGGSLRTKSSKLRVIVPPVPRRARCASRSRAAARRLASWTSRGRAGANTVTLTRQLPTGKTLKPGSYTLAVGLSATAKSSRVIRVR